MVIEHGWVSHLPSTYPKRNHCFSTVNPKVNSPEFIIHIVNKMPTTQEIIIQSAELKIHFHKNIKNTAIT